MELRQLRCFIQVVEAGSFGKAALLLRLAQPALSRQIRNLEDEMGVALLIRHAGGVRPTEAGETLLDHARAILRQAELARQTTVDRAAAIRGKVAIGLPAPVCLAFGAAIARDCLDRFPAIGVSLIEGRSVELETWLLQGNLDLAVLYDPSATRLLLHEPIATEELVLFGHAGETRLPERLEHVEELARFPLLLPTRPNTVRQVLDRLARQHDFTIDAVIELNSHPTTLRLVAEGLGYGILPRLSVAEGEAKGLFRCCRLPQPALSHRLTLSSPTDRPLTRASRELARRLRTLLVAESRNSG